MKILRSIKVKAGIQLLKIPDLEMTCLKIQLPDDCERGMNIFIIIAVLRKILGAGKYDVRISEIEIIRAFINSVQLKILLAEPFRLLDELAQILPVIKISGTEKDHIAVAVRRLDRKFRDFSGNRSIGIKTHRRGTADISQIRRIHFTFRLGFIRINNSGSGQTIEPSPSAERLRIPEITFRDLIRELLGTKNRVILYFGECHTSIGGDRETLPLPVRLRCSIHEVEFSVDLYRIPRTASADLFIILIRNKGDGKFFPLDEIICHIMPPVHGTP